MKYNLKYLEKLHDIIEHNECFLKKTKKISKANSYADLYEMTLEIIYNYNKIKV